MVRIYVHNQLTWRDKGTLNTGLPVAHRSIHMQTDGDRNRIEMDALVVIHAQPMDVTCFVLINRCSAPTFPSVDAIVLCTWHRHGDA